MRSATSAACSSETAMRVKWANLAISVGFTVAINEGSKFKLVQIGDKARPALTRRGIIKSGKVTTFAPCPKSPPLIECHHLYGAALLVAGLRSEEHTSELQSRGHLVCRLLLEKKKKKTTQINTTKQQTARVR